MNGLGGGGRENPEGKQKMRADPGAVGEREGGMRTV